MFRTWCLRNAGPASSSVQASFLGVFGITSIPLTAAATATPGPGSTINVCILLVNPLYYAELETNGGAQLNGPNCEIDVLSTQSPAAIFNTTLNVQNICIKGSTIIKNGGVNPPVQTNCAAISDPFAGTLPNVSVGTCGFSNQSFNGSVTLNPGVYCGYTNFNGTGTITLNPGLYVVSGATLTFNSGQTVIGNGVTFYLADHNATIEFNGGVAATLSAPTSGTYANILIFEPSGMASGSPITINGSAGDSFSGLFYLPSRDVTINSVSNMTTNKVTMVFSSLILDQINWAIDQGALAMSRSLNNAPYLSH